MAAAPDTLMTPIQPNERDVRLARRSSSQMSRLKSRRDSFKLVVTVGDKKEELTIPAVAFHMLEVILSEMAQGHAVAISPVDREISTQKAADLLNVSRPYLIKLLESGQIPFRKIGTHRRVRVADVLEYKARMDAEADRAFAELVEQGQELGLGYE
jgi:excisionase family DNA binding protein